MMPELPFKTCLLCRLAEEEVLKHITTTDESISRTQARTLLRSWFLASQRGVPSPRSAAAQAPAPASLPAQAASASEIPQGAASPRLAPQEAEAAAWADDCAFLAWSAASSGTSVIAAELKVPASPIYLPVRQLVLL